MRPLLIYKYDKDRRARAEDFYEMFQDEGNELRKIYTKEKMKSSKT